MYSSGTPFFCDTFLTLRKRMYTPSIDINHLRTQTTIKYALQSQPQGILNRIKK
jgi:hypothetical protein